MQPYMIVPAQGSDPTDEWLRLGVDAQIAGNLPLAQQRYQQSLRLDPRNALATQNLAIVFAQSNLLNEALLTIERASILDGVHGVISMNWALMALESDRIDTALSNARKAVEQTPNVSTWMALALIAATAGVPEEAVPLYNKILDLEPKHPAAGPNSCFVQTLTNSTPQELLIQRQRWWKANHYEGTVLTHSNSRSIDRSLKVGYVSGDFKQHSAAFIFSRILLSHSSNIEMYLYSTLPVDPASDARTKIFMDSAGSRWRDISKTTDEEADTLIRKDKIDILVDLAAHTNGGRLALFTRKPAPIQVTAWGFAHGTGCPEVDYFFADSIAILESERQYYAEKIWDLPCIVTMNPPTEYNLKGTSSSPFKKNGYITFGSYARYEKMSDVCIKTFAEILRRVPESKLEFKDHAYRRPYSLRRILSLMPDISPDRLLFSIATSHTDHMLAYQQADIILDPFPHTGGVVGLEQLYMGVPIVTLYGSQPAGRSTTSVLANIGRIDWIARTPEEYVEVAVRMSDNPKLISDARKTLRDELLNSKVVNGYVEAVEQAYKDMWIKYINKDQ